MAIVEREQRVRALEAAVIELRSKVPVPNREQSNVDGENMIMDVKGPLIPCFPPKGSKCLPARIRVVQGGRRILSSSSTELVCLSLGDAHERPGPVRSDRWRIASSGRYPGELSGVFGFQPTSLTASGRCRNRTRRQSRGHSVGLEYSADAKLRD